MDFAQVANSHTNLLEQNKIFLNENWFGQQHGLRFITLVHQLFLFAMECEYALYSEKLLHQTSSC